MRRLPIFLTVASLAAFTACITGKDADTGDTWADADTDTDADSDTDADADSDADSDADADVPHDYKTYEGTETYNFSLGQENPGVMDCSVVWDTVGTYRDACVGCDFAFDVALTYNATSSYDNSPDGVCAPYMSDAAFTYGYSVDYDGYGPTLMYNAAGTWYGIWDATFDGSSFTYANGTVDYYYDGGEENPQYTGYYNNFYSGVATVSK